MSNNTCPKCESTNIDIEPIEEDCWSWGRNEGHYTRVIGYGGLCLNCGHEWDASDSVAPEDDGPDPDDRDDFDVDADSRAGAYFGEESNRREPK